MLKTTLNEFLEKIRELNQIGHRKLTLLEIYRVLRLLELQKDSEDYDRQHWPCSVRRWG